MGTEGDGKIAVRWGWPVVLRILRFLRSLLFVSSRVHSVVLVLEQKATKGTKSFLDLEFRGLSNPSVAKNRMPTDRAGDDQRHQHQRERRGGVFRAAQPDIQVARCAPHL